MFIQRGQNCRTDDNISSLNAEDVKRLMDKCKLIKQQLHFQKMTGPKNEER